MGEENCALLDKCLVVKETKKNKRLTRLVNCNNCDKAFHVYCCGWKELSENEVTEVESTFVCNKCNGFISAVADKIYEKMNYVLNAMKEEITQLRHSNVELKATVEKYKCSEVPVVADLKTLSTENLILTQSNDNGNNAEISKKQTATPTTTTTKTTTTTQKHDTKILYLCSIESQLSINDIQLILSDANIEVDDVAFNQPDKDFRTKKYVEINSLNAVKLFKFKFSFEKSNLNGTWFLRTSPPKSNGKNSYKNASNLRGFATHQQNSRSNSSYQPSYYKNANYNSTSRQAYSNNTHSNNNKNHSFKPITTQSQIHKNTQSNYQPGILYNTNRNISLDTNNIPYKLPNQSYANALTHNVPKTNSGSIIPFLENLVQSLRET